MGKYNGAVAWLGSGLSSAGSSIPTILGPSRGLWYIIAIPFMGIASIIILGSFRAYRGLATSLHKSSQISVKPSDISWKEIVGQGELLQSIINGLNCDFMVINLNRSITQYLRPLPRRDKVMEQKAIGQHCFEVSHNRNSPCESCDCECPLEKVIKTNDNVTVTHFHENQFEGECKKSLVTILASPIRDKRNNITQIAELIWDADNVKPSS